MELWKEGRGRAVRNKRFKRAQTACHRCRAKKTKCDNRRPSCNVCIENHAQCIYGELERGQQVHEPTMREMFDRLDHIANLLEFDRRPPSYASTDASSRPVNQSLSPPDTNRRAALPAGFSPSHVFRESTPAGISFESTLNWPVFRALPSDGSTPLAMQRTCSLNQLSPCEKAAEHVVEDAASNMGAAVGDPINSFVEIDTSHVNGLCQRYLTVVHVKNPIFELSSFRRHVNRVVEHGLEWSEGSCAVMLACALASTVKRVRESFDSSSSFYESPETLIKPADTGPISGETYYLAAKKRLGLLDVTLTSVQCFFLAGLYEICHMRPANAWAHYSQACSRLLFILSQENVGDGYQSPDFYVLERLYFSCCRTELVHNDRDLREELHLPPSGITTVEFPREFPSLPSWTSFRSNFNNQVSHTAPDYEASPANIMRQQEEESWYYYLACIALRKEANSIIDLLYRPGVRVWMEKVEHVIAQAALQEHELDQWQTLLPAVLRFDPDNGAPEDLALILECRQLQWRQVSYRPLLYYALHRPDTDPYYHRVLPFAQKCLHYCTLTIKRLLRPHHCEATWFIQRSIATATLLVLAAQIREPPLYVPNWKALVNSSLRTLAVRRAIAPDLDRAQQTIKRIFNDVVKERD